ncbi:hypothetical protein EVAR_98848_1 [Eumeta japonica]|uniref:Uncharacterized protein n=1 Tax=Eumeta variegata TaxID=151549 RepID=A0A4C2ACK2_EUMVA|nr:hypothetical protein EVAR_98848_1 [Eumeta japonica]
MTGLTRRRTHRHDQLELRKRCVPGEPDRAAGGCQQLRQLRASGRVFYSAVNAPGSLGVPAQHSDQVRRALQYRGPLPLPPPSIIPPSYFYSYP